MSEACKTCSKSGECTDDSSCSLESKVQHNIKHVIAVMSGKGGVGKSSVTSLLAASLQQKGFKVGIMDADVTGPSIPKIFGLKTGELQNGEVGIIPAKTQTGIEMVSINLILPNEEDPVIWRGPVISGVITQFWEEVEWGELDYLLVDLPPGTGDVPLTVMQSLPLSGVVIVNTPQSLVSLIVKKSINMVNLIGARILGIIENMAYLECPDCKTKINLFGTENNEELAETMGVPLLGQLPLDPAFVQNCDRGQIEEYLKQDSTIKTVMGQVVEELSKTLAM